MLVVLLCCMMKLVEMSAFASSPHCSKPSGGGGTNLPPPLLASRLCPEGDNSAAGSTGRLVARKKRRRYIKGSGVGKTIILGNKSSKNIAASKHFSGGAVAMTGGGVDVADAATVGVGGGTLSPADSDCNSNPHHHNNISCLSDDTSSHQDIEFIQDNQDYQWFLDYGYRDNNHASILSLAESYEAADLGYYDTLAKNMDANLAEADIESFRTEDIHALLTNLPPMCTDQLSQENNRQGESYASISNSLLGMHFTNSHNSSNRSNQSNTSSQSLNHLNDNDYSTMSICKSELLFSPVKEAPEGGNLLLPLGGVNFSVDSLDCDDLMLTCQNTNMENYTIAFEGSGGGFDGEEEEEWEEGGEEHGYQFNIINQQQNTQSLRKIHIARLQKMHNNSNKNSLDSMTQSDSGNLTTWSKLKKLNRNEGKMERHPSGNNNQTTVDDSTSQATLQLSGHLSGPTVKSQSMPNLYGKKVNSSDEQERIVVPSVIYLVNKSQLNTSDSSTECPTIKRKPVKVFNIQHQSTTSGTSGSSVLSEMATSVDGGSTSSAHSKVQAQQNFSLVKLFMKQKSISAEGMSTALDDQSSICENWNFSTSCNENKTSNFKDSLMQTYKYNSATSEIVNNKQQFMEKVLKTTKINNTDSTNDRGLTLNLNSNYKSSSNNNNNASLEINDYNTRKMQHQKLKSRSTNTKRNSKNCSENQMSSDSSNSSFTKPSKLLQKHFPIHLMNKSIQTSTLLMDSLTNITNKAAPYKLNGGCQNNQGYVKRDKFKVIEPSFLSKLKKEGEIEQSEKPVYVLYPNYVLPNLDFLNERNESTKVILLPQKPSRTSPANHRPFSCNDLEALLKRGGGRNQFSHIRDWDSLLPLLPQEYQQVLAKVPEVCNGGGSLGRRKPSATIERTGSCNSSSSGYRGSSTILSSDLSTPSSAAKFNPLFVYRYDSNTSSETSQTAHTNVPPMLPKRMNLISGGGKAEMVPPRPPLPRGILRRGNNGDVKLRPRYSMFEMTEEEFYSEIANKRRSLQEPYHGMIRNKRLSETEDEGVDAGTSSSSLDSNDHHFQHQNQPRNQHFNQQSTPNNYQPQNSILFTNLNHEDLRQLEDFLQQSNNTSNSSVDNNTSSRSGSDQQASREVISDDLGMLELRSQVSRFLALRINNQCQDASGGRKVSFKGETEGRGPNNSPLNVSCMTTQKLSSTKQPSTLIVDMPDIHEESTPPTTSNPSSYHSSPRHIKRPPSQSPQPTNNILKQQHLITAVTDSVERVIHEFSAATNQPELDALGDSARNPSGAKVALTRLCPALYAVLSDGLKGVLETSFGPIGNSVWQVVEASAQQGPLTKALNDLVMRINAEDVITEGLVKFNAFVFGLLNVRSLDAWLSYLRTRESVLRKHYDQDALLVKALMGGTEVRQLLDSLIATVQPLALLPFQYDLLFEYRLLHESLKKMDTYQQQLSPTHQQFKPWKANNTAPPTETPTLPDLLNNSTSTTPPHLIVNVKHTSNSAPKIRPRSYVDNFRHTSSSPGNTVGVNRCNMDGAFDNPNDIHGNQPRRWSGISANNKLFQAYSKLEGDEEYMDSLEEFSGTPYFIPQSDATNIPPSNQPESLESNASLNDEKPLNGRKFKKLQRRWELLSGTNISPPESPCILPQKEQHHIISPVNANPQQSFPNLLQNSPSGNTVPSSANACKLSKIPRPVTSPVKPISGSNGSGSSIPVMISPQGSKSGCKKVGAVVGMSPVKKPVAAPRTSRLDQLEQNNQETRILARPSSLPYKPNNSISKGSKITPPRRAISTSVNRKGASGVIAFNHAKLPRTSRTE